MKIHARILVFSLMLFVAIACLQSCNKKSDDKPATNTVSANVNGTALSFSQITVSTDTLDPDVIATIVASSADGKARIALHVAYKLIGTTATIDIAKKDFVLIKYLDAQNEYRAYSLTPGSSGTATITRNDATARRLEGTYKCTAVRVSGPSSENTKFLEGSFAITY